MKTIITVSFLLSFTILQAQPDWALERFKKYEAQYALANFLRPRAIEADISGDSIPDVALQVQRKSDKKKGIMIFFGQSDSFFIMGAGKYFGNGGDDYKWANDWNLFGRETATQTTFDGNGDAKGSREIKLVRPGILITDNRGSGAVIYYNGKNFIWIHQGD